MKSHPPVLLARLGALALAATLVLLLVPASGRTQICGDANGDGKVNLVDQSSILSALLCLGAPLSPGADLDGWSGVTLRDYVMLVQIQWGKYPQPATCAPVPTPSAAQARGNALFLMHRCSQGQSTSAELYLRHTDTLAAFCFAVSFIYGNETCTVRPPSNVYDSIVLWGPSVRQGDDYLLFEYVADTLGFPPGLIKLADISVTHNAGGYGGGCVPPEPFEMFWASPQPCADNQTDQTHPWFIKKGDLSVIEPTLGACCWGQRGNIDSDPQEKINLVDLTALINYVTGGGWVPSCKEEADINGDTKINLVDLSSLINHLTGGPFVPAACP